MGEVALKEDPWRKQLEQMRPEWQALFASQQHLDRFRRVVATAINNNPELLDADRRSLFGAATMAAQDGLMPDGREGALVLYNTKIRIDDKDHWIKAVRWMPMVAGVLKKIRQSGELLDISVQVAYAADHFTYQLGDDALRLCAGVQPGRNNTGMLTCLRANADALSEACRNALDALPKHGVVIRPARVECVVHPPIPTRGWKRADLDRHIAEIRQLYVDTLES